MHFPQLFLDKLYSFFYYLTSNYRKTNPNLKLTLFPYSVSQGEFVMKTSEIISKLDIPRHKLYYLEQKGYVKPKRIPMGDLEAREFSKQELRTREADYGTFETWF